MVPTKLDHCVIHVSDWDRSNKFYDEVMGAELVQRPHGLGLSASATSSSMCMGRA